MEEQGIVLGNVYTDKITGFTGPAIGISRWLTGCSTVGLQGKVSDGKVPDLQWFDVTRLTGEPYERSPGGPQGAAPDPGTRSGR